MSNNDKKRAEILKSLELAKQYIKEGKYIVKMSDGI